MNVLHIAFDGRGEYTLSFVSVQWTLNWGELLLALVELAHPQLGVPHFGPDRDPQATLADLHKRVLRIEFQDSGYAVHDGSRYTWGLALDEMLAQVAQLTHPKIGVPQYPMKTASEWGHPGADAHATAAPST